MSSVDGSLQLSALVALAFSLVVPDEALFVATILAGILAIVLMAGIREKLELATVPDMVQGTAITLMIAGILSLAFMGFAGLGTS